MTSTFDTIASFEYWINRGVLTNEEVKEARSILDEAVRQASSRRPSKWSFKKWLKMRDTTEAEWDDFIGHEKAAQFSFISITHSVLDHDDKWHLKVFNRHLVRRIEALRTRIRRRSQ